MISEDVEYEAFIIHTFKKRILKNCLSTFLNHIRTHIKKNKEDMKLLFLNMLIETLISVYYGVCIVFGEVFCS
jgi:hypothetical protein